VTTDTEALRVKLAAIPTSFAADLLRKHGADRLLMRGVQAMQGVNGSVAGPARTLRFLPARSDVTASPAGNIRMKLIDSAQPGEVLVFDTMGSGGPVFGDMVALRAVKNGVAALVTDGKVRDVAAVGEIGLPLFAAGTAPAPSGPPMIAWEADTPIQCGGVLVFPGDWILGDGDGVMVIPRSLVADVIERADALVQEEGFCQQLLQRGHSLAEVFPMPAGLRPLFTRYLGDGKLPSEAEVHDAAGRSG
jgi:5-oxopent-3-ene-1,2,5-tricarboxylate decarboxylase/2-hydroxyhepta-2,4-diene-1,7-dioate isomerase